MRWQRDLGFAIRIAAFYAAIFVVLGIQLPFLPVWLTAKGLAPQMIGIVLAVPMVVRVFAIPWPTRLADRRNALRTAIIVGCCASFVGYGLLALADGTAAVLLTYALASIAFTPVMPLADTYAMRGVAERGIGYGSVRLWGSVAFIFGTYAGGVGLDNLPAVELIWFIVAATLMMVAAAYSLTALPATSTSDPARPGRPKPLLRDPSFVAVLAAASLIQASHAIYYGFSSLQWRAIDLDGTTIAALWALGVVAEIVFFAISGRLSLMERPTVLLIIGAIGATVRWAAMAFDPPQSVLPFLQVLHALSFGATYLGALQFVARHAAPEESATAQGYLAIASGAVMAVATGLSGVLYAALGARAYAAMALAAIVGGACAAIAQGLGRKMPC